MRVKYKYLTYTQRLQIEAYLKIRMAVKDIALNVGVHVSTVYREIKRGFYNRMYKHIDYVGYKYYYKNCYSPDIAQQATDLNQSRKGAQLKIGKDFKLAEYIETSIIRNKLSPLACIGEIRNKELSFNTSICVQTLYSYIRKGVFLKLKMSSLPIGERKRRRKELKICRAPRGLSIEQRPLEVRKRDIFGHWEMDTLHGPTNSSLLVFAERMTRYVMIFKLNDRKAESVVACLNNLEKKYGNAFNSVFKSITVDNGTEFSDCAGMQSGIYGNKRTTIYYCHPYTSCERGTNERLNREVRRLIKKGSNISLLSHQTVSEVQNWVNNYPRQIFGFATSQEKFTEQLNLL